MFGGIYTVEAALLEVDNMDGTFQQENYCFCDSCYICFDFMKFIRNVDLAVDFYEIIKCKTLRNCWLEQKLKLYYAGLTSFKNSVSN